jgi:hypothetical protein
MDYKGLNQAVTLAIHHTSRHIVGIRKEFHIKAPRLQNQSYLTLIRTELGTLRTYANANHQIIQIILYPIYN